MHLRCAGSAAQDPDGSYVRRWVPELAKLPNKYMHAPWDAPPATLASAGVVLGLTYPERIIHEDLQARVASASGCARSVVADGCQECCWSRAHRRCSGSHAHDLL